MRARWLACVVVLFSGIALPAAAQSWRTERGLYGAALTTTQGSEEEIARALIATEGATLGFEGGPLALVRVVHAHGYTIVELARVVNGLGVVGAPLVVRLRPDGAADMIEIAPMPSARAAWPTSSPIQGATAAAIDAATFAGARALDARFVALVHEDAVVPAVIVELAGTRPSDRFRAYVDATSFAVLWLEPRVLDVLGRVYPNNPVNDAMVTMDLPLEALTSTSGLQGTHLNVGSCDQLSADCNTVRHAVPDADGNYLFEPMPRAFDDAFSEVSAYYHGSRVVDYFDTAHHFTWTCMGGVQMEIVVNYTEMPNTPYENAMFEPGTRSACGLLVFGQGALHDYAYDGDVVYHEYGHAVTDQISTLGFFAMGPSDNYQPLAINEGTSDYWAAAVQGDPHIGESIGNLEGAMGPLRGLDSVVSCPASLFGEGHTDGVIWSSFGWAMRGIVGQTESDAIWYTTMASLSGGVTLAQGTNVVLSTVASEVTMGHVTADQQTMIQAAADMRGLPDCTMFQPLDDAHGHSGYSGNSFVTGGLSHGLAPLGYTLQIPPNATSVEIDISHPTLTGLTNVHFSNGMPVRANGSRVFSSHMVTLGRGGTAVYALADGLTPCSTLYVGIETTDLRAGESLYEINGRVFTSDGMVDCPAPMPDAGPAMPDAGAIDDGGSDASATPPAASSNCGCAVGTRTSASPWLLALALAMLARRRVR